MSDATSSARAFLGHINTQPDPFAFLSTIGDPEGPLAPFFEEEWLDFKGAPKDDNNAKEIWSKALSGYSNIIDGVIVWGIDARKMPPRGIDAASGLRLITDPHAFESKLREWVRDATNPPVTGVEFQSYLGPGGEGFVLCLIPQSNYSPHRAEWAKRQYYYRASDDFLQAEPGLLRTLFFPQRSCQIDVKLSIEYELVHSSLSAFEPPDIKLTLVSGLVVGGSSSGRDVYITACWDPEIEIKFGTGQDWQYFGHGPKKGFRATRTLHPGEEIALFWGREPKLEKKCRMQNDQWVLSWAPLSFEFEVYVADQERHVIRHHFDGESMQPGNIKGITHSLAL